MAVLEGACSRQCLSPGAGMCSKGAASISTSFCLSTGRRNSLSSFPNGAGKFEIAFKSSHSPRNSGYKASSVRLMPQCRGKGFGDKSQPGGRGQQNNGSSISGNGSPSSPEVMPLNPKVDRAGGEEVAGKGAWEGLNWKDFATPAASPVLNMSEPKVYYFAVASAHSLLTDGALLEEVLADGIQRCQRGGRQRDVWLVLQPAFLEHKTLTNLKAALPAPTAAIITTNGSWMMSVVPQMLPQATIGKFYAPTPSMPDPLRSTITPNEALGGGGVWH